MCRSIRTIPVERLEFMLADAHVEVLLTQDGSFEEVEVEN